MRTRPHEVRVTRSGRLPPRIAPVLVLLALVASACGTTVPLSERQQRALNQGVDPGIDGLEEFEEITDGTSAPGAGAVAGTRTTSGGAGSTTTGGGRAAVAGPPPVTENEIRVGIAYHSDPGTANQAAGFAGIGQVDQKRAWDAMVAEVNKNPPHGRKVVPVYYSFTTNDITTKGSEQLAQETCTHWTRDNRVFMSWGASTDNLRACLTRARVAQIGSGTGFSYEKTWQDYPWYVEHNSSALDRMAKDQIDQLATRGHFATCKRDPSVEPCVDGKPRIALIRYDQPSHSAAAAVMKRTLASHGLQLCSGCEFEVSYSSDNIGAQLDDATEVNSAINSCRTPRSVPGTDTPAGPCTHMLFLGSTAGVRITLFYVQRAEDQQYRAKLGFNRMDVPTTVRNFYAGQGQTRYFEQFRQSMLVSYAPGDFGIQPEAHKECKAIMERAGETFGGSDDSSGNKEAQIGGYCDSGWYHMAALNAAGSSLTLDTFLRGVANTGQVKSASTFVMRTTATRRDGAGAVRIGQWFDDCNCIKAVTGDIPV